jgi:tight adherence protein C
MSAAAAWSIVLGAALGFGFWTLVGIVPRVGVRRLGDRVAPYLVDVSDEARAWVDRPSGDPVAVVWGLLGPVFGRFFSLLSVFLASSRTVSLRLGQRGSLLDVPSFRRRQLLWAVAGVAAVTVPVIATVASGALPPFLVTMLPVLGAMAGALACEWELARGAKRRVARIEAELPTALGFLSLSLSAGEGILDALRRVAQVGSGEFSAECRRVAADVGSGVPLARALTDLSERLALPALSRTVEQLTGALERGSPLAETLRAQSADVRVEGKRRLLESAGRKEVAMLVPTSYEL